MLQCKRIILKLEHFTTKFMYNSGVIKSISIKRFDCSFEHPKHMFKLMGKEIITILGSYPIDEKFSEAT